MNSTAQPPRAAPPGRRNPYPPTKSYVYGRTLVIFIIRTRGRPWRDLPNPILTISTLAALVTALAIPFSPLGEWFGFRSLPPHLAIALVGIVAIYLVCAEVFKPLAVADSPSLAGQAIRAIRP